MLSLAPEEKDLVLKRLAPLGQVPSWDHFEEELSLTSTPARRFINDQTAAVQQPRSYLLSDPKAYDDGYLGIGIYEAISTALIQQDYELYLRLYSFMHCVDTTATKSVLSCEQAAVLLAHESFGKELFPHIHARSHSNRPTLSVFCNLTGEETSALTLFEPLKECDKAYEVGYTKHRVLAATVRQMKSTELTIKNGQCVLFDAQHTPHKYSYDKDLWMVFVYDQVQCFNWRGETDTWMISR